MQLVFRGVGCARSAGMRAASGALRPARRSAKRLLPTERKRAELPVGYAYKKSAAGFVRTGTFSFRPVSRGAVFRISMVCTVF